MNYQAVLHLLDKHCPIPGRLGPFCWSPQENHGDEYFLRRHMIPSLLRSGTETLL